jgi:hypothetical protein
MFLDLEREMGFITKTEGRNYMLMLSTGWYAGKDKVETSTAEDLGDDNIIDEDRSWLR